VDDRALGKPSDPEDAARMLRLLSGRTHHVFTAVSLLSPDGTLRTETDASSVTFDPLSEEEISAYVASGEPMDKAGAYGVQEWIGYIACTAMNGSYFNVMGFPVHRVYEQLKNRGIV
jgi:septum formation protein